MFVAKQFDIIIGVDTHIVMIPTPGGPVPTPLPHPFIGIVFDPMTFVPMIGSTILVNGIPRGVAGTKVKNAIPHIPMGGPFQKPPQNEGEIQMGRLTVFSDWQPCSFSGLPALTCSDIGQPAPDRESKDSSGKIKGLVMPTSFLLAIPKGGVVASPGTPTPKAKKGKYKVFFKAKLNKKYWPFGRATHFQRANQSLYNRMKNDPNLRRRLGKDVWDHVQPGQIGRAHV